MELTGDTSRGNEQARPAVSVETARTCPLEEVACKVTGNSELPGQLRAVEG